MATQTLAPWFFRQRFALFGLVYGASFFFGNIIAGVLRVPPRPAFLSSTHTYLLAVLAVICIAGGYALRLWASSFIAARVVWTQDVQLGELTVNGPYRFTRNPLYVGNLLQAIGIGLLGPWPVEALLAVLMLAYCLILISIEEPYLAKNNGTAYAAFSARVPRFVPLPWKVAPSGQQRGSWRDGLRSEAMTGTVALAATAFIAWRLATAGR